MRFSHLFSLVLLTATFPVGALADDSTDLYVSGKIIPGSCELGLGNRGHFNFGRHSTDQLNPEGMTLLGTQETEFTIRCTGPTKIEFALYDNQEDTAVALPLRSYEGVTLTSDLASVGLGRSPDGSKIGAYMVELKKESFTDAGAPIGVLYQGSVADRWMPATTNARFFPTQRLFSFGSVEPDAVSDISGTLRVSVGVAHDQGMLVNDEIEMDGDSTILLFYY